MSEPRKMPGKVFTQKAADALRRLAEAAQDEADAIARRTTARDDLEALGVAFVHDIRAELAAEKARADKAEADARAARAEVALQVAAERSRIAGLLAEVGEALEGDSGPVISALAVLVEAVR